MFIRVCMCIIQDRSIPFLALNYCRPQNRPPQIQAAAHHAPSLPDQFQHQNKRRLRTCTPGSAASHAPRARAVKALPNCGSMQANACPVGDARPPAQQHTNTAVRLHKGAGKSCPVGGTRHTYIGINELTCPAAHRAGRLGKRSNDNNSSSSDVPGEGLQQLFQLVQNKHALAHGHAYAHTSVHLGHKCGTPQAP
eukprot:1157645-Pelagomonas_calceolata.AAC.1